MLAGGRLADAIQLRATADAPGMDYISEKLQVFQRHSPKNSISTANVKNSQLPID
jgi:hypothetical protein